MSRSMPRCVALDAGRADGHAVGMPRNTPLAAADAARLHMSTRQNPMVIVAALLLDRRVARAAVEEVARRLAAAHARFRSVVVEGRAGLRTPRWAERPDLDAGELVRRVGCPWPGDESALAELLSNLASTPLDPAAPLWQLHLVDGVDDGGAIVLRVHHALADGGALLALLAELSDEGARAATRLAPGAARTPAKRHASRIERLAGGVAGARKLLLGAPEPRTALRVAPSGRKRLAFSPPLVLHALEARAHAGEATIAAVLLAAVAGALRGALGHDDAADRLRVHALVPVRTPGAGEGNHFGSARVRLPVHLAGAHDRLRAAADALASARAHHGGAAGGRLAEAAGAGTRAMEHAGVALFSRKASAVVSSVRGPAAPAHVCGAEVKDIVVWAPAPGSVTLAVTLMSYAGRVRVGVMLDASVALDAGALARDLASHLV